MSYCIKHNAKLSFNAMSKIHKMFVVNDDKYLLYDRNEISYK